MTYRTFPYHVTQMRSQSHRRGRRPDDPQDDGRILYRKRKIRNIRFCQADEDTRVQMPYPILLCTLHFLNRRCSLSNALPREHQGTPLQFHCNVSCRGGALRNCPNLLRCCQNLDFGYSTHALADLANNTHATTLQERTRVSAIGLVSLLAYVTSGVPTTPRVVGRGGVAARGQGIPTGYAYRVQRTTTTTKLYVI